MLARVSDNPGGQQETSDGVADPEIEWDRSQPVNRRQIPGQKRRQANRKVAGEFIEADRKAPLAGADKIDFHYDGHRPGKSLVDAEQYIGGYDPLPGRCPHNQEWHRQTDHPPQDQRLLASPAIGKLAGYEVGDRLDDSETDNEGRDRHGG